MEENTTSPEKHSAATENISNGSTEKADMSKRWNDLWREGKERAREIGSLPTMESGLPPRKDRSR